MILTGSCWPRWSPAEIGVVRTYEVVCERIEDHETHGGDPSAEHFGRCFALSKAGFWVTWEEGNPTVQLPGRVFWDK